MWSEFHTGEFLIGDLVSHRITFSVELSADHQALCRGGVGDQLDDHFVTDEWTTAPVLGDVAEHAVLDLVPLTRPGRKVTHLDRQLQAIGKILQSHFPEAASAAVAASPIGSDQQISRVRIALAPHFLPPSVNRLRGKLSGVVVNAHADPALVVRYIVDPVRNSLPEGLVHEVVDAYLVGLPLWHPFAASVLEVTHQLLLLGIDRDYRLAALLETLDHRANVFELRIAVRMRIPFLCLAIPLQAVTGLTEQSPHCRTTHWVPLCCQLPS